MKTSSDKMHEPLAGRHGAGIVQAVRPATAKEIVAAQGKESRWRLPGYA